MGFLDNIAEDAADLIGGEDTLLGGIASNLVGAAAAKLGFEKPSGSAPTSIEKTYNEYIQKKGKSKNLWYIDGKNWHKIFGHRFSIAHFEGDPSKSNSDIGQVLSSGPAGSKYGSSIGSQITSAISAGVGALLGDDPEEDKSPNVEFKHFTLPIPPQSMVIKPILPSRITPTIGGVVEETSEVKLWTISMSGTTGIAPSQTASSEPTFALIGKNYDRKTIAKTFREVLETTGLKSGKLADNENSTDNFSPENEVVSSVSAIVPDDPLSVLNGIAGAVSASTAGSINDSFLPSLPYHSSGVDESSNGFTEAQELQKFFFMYNGLKGRYPKGFALLFSNSKTDQTWRCVIKDFMLQQSAEHPNMFRYKIDMQCWGVGKVADYFKDDGFDKPYDRFGPGGDLTQVNLVSNTATIDILKKINNP